MSSSDQEPLSMFVPEMEAGVIPRDGVGSLYRYIRWGRIELRVYSDSFLDKVLKPAASHTEIGSGTIVRRAA